MDSKLSALIDRLEAATVKLENLSGSPAAAAGEPASTGATAPAVAAYDEIINGPLKEFLSLSSQIGGLVQEQVCQINIRHCVLKRLLLLKETLVLIFNQFLLQLHQRHQKRLP